MSVSKKNLVVAGLPVTIYAERELSEKSGPVAVLFFLLISQQQAKRQITMSLRKKTKGTGELRNLCK